MENKLKYIIIQDADGIESPIVFPSVIDHIYISKKFENVISAGKINIYKGYFPKGWKPEDLAPNPQISIKHGSFTMNIKYNKERQEVDQVLIEYFLKPAF